MNTVRITSHKKREIIDITDEVTVHIKNEKAHNALIHLFVLHTTAAITTADLDPGTDQDMLDVFEKIIPKLHFRHPHNPEHAPDHILASIIGPSLTVPVVNGELQLGTWQRIVFIELDGPRTRKLAYTIVSSE